VNLDSILPARFPALALSFLFGSLLLSGLPASAGTLHAAGGAPSAQAGQQVSTPPGTVLIQGGRTRLGTDLKALERLLEQHPALRGARNTLVSETPQFTENVPSFFLMVNTVTNEQYKAFVDATGARPPHTWGGAAVEVGRSSFLEEEGRRRREAQLANQPLPERRTFDPDSWWRRNWRDHAWEMPAKLALEPVVYVDYQDALAYARWAGMRLPSEFEYQRAVRGNSDRDYPWGPSWEPGRAATNELPGVRGIFPIASFPGGVSPEGVHDLSGNVWQWTSSPFVPFPGYKDLPLTFGRGASRERVTAAARFDANQRVSVGGSVQNEPLAARVTTRRGTDRNQSTSALSFRCAASVDVGWDIAATILEEHVPVSIRPTDTNGPVGYEPKLAVATDRWIFRAGSDHKKGIALPEARAKGESVSAGALPAEYSIITGYEHVVFVPAAALYATGPNELRDLSLVNGPVHIGILSTSLPVVEPALEAGTYLVAIRGAGERQEPRRAKRDDAPAGEDEEEAPSVPIPTRPSIREQLPTIDIQVDNFIFYDMTGTPVAHHRIRSMDWGNITPSTTAISQRTRKEIVDDKEVEVPETWYEQRLFLPGRGGRQGLKLTLPLRFEEGTLEGDWRRSR
jgi:formylglycine-generating enzyme required for sulfatase activity